MSRIYHVCERHQEHDANEVIRKGFAQQSWQLLYSQGVIPRHLWSYPRNSNMIGDHRGLPFLRDVLWSGMEASSQPDDIVMFTNDDNFLHPELPAFLEGHIHKHDCCSSQRCEFSGSKIPTGLRNPEQYAKISNPHMGRDMFAFAVLWLRQHWKEIPDYVLGASDWDLGMACLIRLHHGIISTRRNIEECIMPATIPRGYVLHQFHPPKWQRPEIIHSAPAQIRNRNLFRLWARANLPNMKFNEHNQI